MKDSINIDWALLGAELALLSDEEQAMFFTGFAKELDNFKSHYHKEMQMVYVNAKLSTEVIKILKDYLPMLFYLESEDK